MSEKIIVRYVLAVAAVMLAVADSRADVFNMPAGQTSLQTVTVGDPGNAPNTVPSIPASAMIGEVDYSYSIGKYEVTNAQYCQFLDAKLPDITDVLDYSTPYLPDDQYGLYNCNMSLGTTSTAGINYDPNAAIGDKFSPKPGMANLPVSHIAGFEAIRFINWLQNGQSSGDTESGTYLILNGGQNSGTLASPDDPRANETPNAAGHWVLPTENEWYKAAFYKGGGTNSGYWLYPTSHDSTPSYYPPGTPGADPTNSANYYVSSPPGYPKANNSLLDVGSYPESLSPYGTLDQGGNDQEWTETPGRSHDDQWIVRGGEYSLGLIGLASDQSGPEHPPQTDTVPAAFGFRVAYVPSVPEPGSLVMLAGMAVGALLYWRRQA